MIRIVEVGPRDGLQNEPTRIPTDVKVDFVNALSGSGVSEIEVSAFVSPRWVPQLADASAVFERIERTDGIVYSALVPNEKGLERALDAGIDKASLFTAASETFAMKNINTTIQGSLERFGPVLRGARRAEMPVRAYVSAAFWCPYEGEVKPEAVRAVVDRLLDLGVDEVSIADTVGRASAEEVERLLERLLPRLPTEKVAMHFHDTFGRAVDNVLVSRRYGIEVFDASVGGLGGCPYAPGAAGNVSTERVIQALRETGAEVPVDLDALARARTLLADALGLDAVPFGSGDRASRPRCLA